jgi:hypothetical protein
MLHKKSACSTYDLYAAQKNMCAALTIGILQEIFNETKLCPDIYV